MLNSSFINIYDFFFLIFSCNAYSHLTEYQNSAERISGNTVIVGRKFAWSPRYTA